MNLKAAIYIKQLRGGFDPTIGTTYNRVSVDVFENFPEVWKQHTWIAEEYWNDPDRECQKTGQELCLEAARFLGEEDGGWW